MPWVEALTEEGLDVTATIGAKGDAVAAYRSQLGFQFGDASTAASDLRDHAVTEAARLVSTVRSRSLDAPPDSGRSRPGGTGCGPMIGGSTTEASTAERGRGRTGGLVLAAVIVVALVAVAIDNSEEAEVGYVFGSVTAPVWVVLVAAGIAGFIIGWLIKHRSRR